MTGRHRAAPLSGAPPGRSPLTEAEFADAFASVSGPCVLAAVSGGPDSAALLGGLAGWAGARGIAIRVATVDHALRPGSRREAEAVGVLARRFDLLHAILTWAEPRPGQAAARAARYRLLVDHARDVGAPELLTAHTRDDQAETLLIRMADGSGLAGLGGMRPLRTLSGIRHRRPLLAIAKSRLVATCEAEGWPFSTDPTNSDPRFARTRWRALRPLLAQEGLDEDRLARLALRLRRADAALDRWAACRHADLADGSGTGFSPEAVAALFGDPDEIVMRVLERACRTVRPAGQVRLGRLEACAEALAAAALEERPLRRTLAGCLVDLRRDGSLRIGPEAPRRRGLSRTEAGSVAAVP